MSGDNVLVVSDLRAQFGTQVVYEHLDLELERGTVLGVVGGSGTGKSVLMRAIIGLRRPDAGRIQLLGEDLYAASPRQRIAIERRIGVLFQDGALFSSLTVAENVSVPLIEHAALDVHDARRLATLKIALVGLPMGARDKYPSQLSGGMRKRAALARALALDPEIVFLDEPTSGLDPISAAGFDELLRTLSDALGLTVYMNTHDLDTLHALCDKVAVLADRRVVVMDTLANVERFDHPWVQSYFRGPRGRAAAGAHDDISMSA